MTKKRRILICTLYSANTTSGSSKNAFLFTEFITKTSSIKTTILTQDLDKGLIKNEKINDIDYIHIKLNTKSLFGKIFSLSYIIPIYLKIIFNNDIIIIYGKGFWGYEIIILIGKILSKKIIFRSTTLGIDDLVSISKHKLLGKARIKLLNSIFLYFSINPEFTKNWNKFEHQNNTKVLETTQGVNIDLFYPPTNNEKVELRKKLNIPDDELIILSVGHLIKRKGIEEIINILSQINVNFLYVVVGNSNKNTKSTDLFNLGNKLLNKKIYFTGTINNVYDYYKITDIFIHNSMQEGTPNALLEAMATGLPCCVRDLPGVTNYLVFDKINSLIHNNSQELKENILLLNKDNDLRKALGTNARKMIVENHSFQVVTNKLFEFL